MLPSQFSVDFAGKTYPCFFIQDRQTAEKLLAQLESKEGIIAADTETAALPKYKHINMAALSPFTSDIRLLQVFTGTGAAVIDLHKTGKINLKRVFEKRPSVFHNMTFDYKFLRQHYDVVDPDMHCTCIMARCVFHAIYPDNKSASLKDVAITLFGEEISKKAGASDWSIPELTFEQVRYAALDAVVQMAIYNKLNDYIDKLQLRKVYDLYRKAQITICEMELNGLTIDSKKHMENVVRWRQEQLDALEDVLEMTGLTNLTDAKLGKWLELQLDASTLAVWPRTETGKLQTDSNTFVDFSHLDIVKPFSKYQKLKKLTTAFGTKLLNNINEATGKIHPTYRVAGAKTGRLSCTEPNIQQMPRDKSIRSIFIPSPGYELVVADYSQVEVRCIAEMSNDPMMLKAYEEGLDMYSYTASYLTGLDYEVINTKNEKGEKHPARQQAKALVLGLNYGLGAKKFAHYAKKGYDVQISQDESKDLVDRYRELYSGLREWQMRQVDLCQARKYTAFSVMGKSRKMTEDDFYGACMNHPIQGSCAEIMLLALVKVRMYLRGTSGRILASVHDEVIVECLPSDTEKVKKLLQKAMEEAYIEILPSGRTCRNLVEPSSGPNWAEAKS